ncbi:hypothetical protein [Streptomyces anulatus]|uniref:hypothetical protein n=1 Tax=Streptomyces anulatus TaxID=1892 RepID=UPI00367AFB7A
MSENTEDEAPQGETTDATPAFRVRDVFAFRRTKAAADEEPETEAGEEQAQPETPPMPSEPPTVPAQAATTADGAGRSDPTHRVPRWWEADKDITVTPCRHPNARTFRMSTGERIPFSCPDCSTDLSSELMERVTPRAPRAADTVKWINGVPHYVPDPTCKHPAPEEVRSAVNGQLLAFWCTQCETKLDVPEDYDELQDVTKDDGEGDGDEADGGEGGQDGKAVDKVPPAIRRIWGMKGAGTTEYARPVYSKNTAEQKKSLFEAWNGMSRKTRHLLYNGTALGAGLYLGVPQFFTAETAYLVTTYGSWTNFYVVVWYATALGIFALDYRTRAWFPLFAWFTRIPLVSMIVGCLYYGVPAAV